MRETVHVFLGRVHRIVNRVQRRVEKKWLPARRGDEIGRFFSEALRQVLPVFEDFVTIAPEVVEVGARGITPVEAMRVIVDASFMKAIVIIEAVRVGHCFRSASQVPFADKRRLIPHAFQLRRDCLFGWRQCSSVVSHAGANRAASRHQGGTGRCAHRGVGIPVRQYRSAARQPVDVRREQIGRTEKAQVRDAQVVKQNYDDVRLFRRLGLCEQRLAFCSREGACKQAPSREMRVGGMAQNVTLTPN